MNALYNLHSTIVAPATPLNQASALGILRISGPEALTIAKKISTRSIFKPRYMYLSALFNQEGQAIDQGLVVFFPGPFSATGEDVAELHVHGNPLIMNQLLKTCCEFGAKVAAPGEFLYRAFWHKKYDLMQIEGISGLMQGRSHQALTQSMASLTGFATKRLQQYADQLVAFRCQLESDIDFSDQDDVQNNALTLCQSELKSWIISVESDLKKMEKKSVLIEGCELILVGPPNAGKSSLLNALADDEISIIDDQPGTTRDLIKKQIVIKGVPITVCDTAGLRQTGCRIENKGIQKTKEAMRRVGVVVFILPDTEEIDFSLIPEWSELPAKKYLLLNKIDTTNGPVGRRPDHPLFDAVFGISVATKAGLQDWLDVFETDVIGTQTEESGWLANARQQESLRQALASAREALAHMHQMEIAASLLREAHDHLGAITGAYYHDDLLGDIFSSFCIGK